MEFEKSLKERFYQKTLKQIEDGFQRRWHNLNISDETLRDIRFDSIKNSYSIYLESIMMGQPEKQIIKVYDEFGDALSSESLMEMKKNVKLNKQEETYIKYREQFHPFYDER